MRSTSTPPAPAALLLAAAALSACSGTSVQGSWKDPQFTAGPVKNVLVIGVARNPATRRIFEDSFAGRLSARSTPAGRAIHSSRGGRDSQGAHPAGSGPGRGRLRAGHRSSGFSAPCSSRRAVARPTTPATTCSWYAQTWSSAPRRWRSTDVLTIESTLWDIRRERVVWKGTSETTARADVARVTGELANVLIAQMKADRVI